ncbi:hypothetical protein D3C85_1032110 [compost metagenome]
MPTARTTLAAALRNSCRLLAVVAAREAYSVSIEPAYFEASPTFCKLLSSNSKLVSSGVIAAIDSLPNKLVSNAGRLALSTCEMRLSRSSIVPWASFCIATATLLESSRNAL